MKSKRQEKILDLIERYEIETQEELASYLDQAGCHVTQATISRDIRELKLSKVNTYDGRQKYVAMAQRNPAISDRLTRVMREGYVSSTVASQLLIVHTVSGMAMAVAAAIDALELPGLAGCIAGDDTIMCALRSEADVDTLTEKISQIVNHS